MGNAAQQATSQELVELVQKIIKCEHSDYQTVLKKTWDRYNKDKNDFLDKEECKELITHMIQLLFPTSNANDSNAQAELIFEVLDANDDGVVTFGEFQTKMNAIVIGLVNDRKSLDTIAQHEAHVLLQKKKASQLVDDKLYDQEVLVWEQAKRTDDLFAQKVAYFASKDANEQEKMVADMVLDSVLHGLLIETSGSEKMNDTWLCINMHLQKQVGGVLTIDGKKFMVEGTWNSPSIVLTIANCDKFAKLSLNAQVDIKQVVVKGSVLNANEESIGTFFVSKSFEC